MRAVITIALLLWATLAQAQSYVQIDYPYDGNDISVQMTMSGWAVDLASSDGAGIDAVHVWAWPLGGGSPAFLGSATLGGYRLDVAAVFGQRFAYSGYRLAAYVPFLPIGSGDYFVVAYAHSSVTNAFTARSGVLLHFGLPETYIRSYIDAIYVGAVGSTPYLMAVGWAVGCGFPVSVGLEVDGRWMGDMLGVNQRDDVWDAIGSVWTCSNAGEPAGRNQLFATSLAPGWHVARFLTLGNGWGIYSPERWFYVS